MRTPRRCHCPAIAVYAQALGVEPSRTLNAEESVARGAALAAALQSPSFKVRPLLLQEGLLQPYTVHWRADDGGPPSPKPPSGPSASDVAGAQFNANYQALYGHLHEQPYTGSIWG